MCGPNPLGWKRSSLGDPVHALRRLLILLLALAGTGLLVGGVAVAQEGPPPYPPGESEVACDRTETQPGDPPFCRARGFAPGSQVDVVARGPVQGGQAAGVLVPAGADGEVILAAAQGPEVILEATVTADGEGFASVEITVPEDARPGTYEVVFSGRAPDGSPHRATGAFQVPAAEAQPQPEPDGLVRTGAWLTRGLALVVVLIAGGGVLLGLTRRSAPQGSPGDRVPSRVPEPGKPHGPARTPSGVWSARH